MDAEATDERLESWIRPPNRQNRLMRVLHVISGLFYGGGQRVALDLLAALPNAGDVEVTFCTLGEPQEAPLSDHVDFWIPYNGRYNDPRVLSRTAWQLRRRLREGAWDILHTHGLDADLVGALAVYRQMVRHVCHLHVSPPTQRESWKALLRRKLLRKLTQQNHSSFIAVSETVRREMAQYYGFPINRIVTVRNGINIDEFGCHSTQKAISDGSVVIGTAGRLAPMKGFEYLINAMSELSNSTTECALRIAGMGNLHSELAASVSRQGLSETIHFDGHVANMARFFNALDIFVLPSLSEGMPLTILEAMASGLPVVATSVGGTAEALRHGIDGILVPPADHRQLANGLSQLIRSPDLRQRMGQNAQQRARCEFSRDRVAREVAGVYDRVLGSTTTVATAG